MHCKKRSIKRSQLELQKADNIHTGLGTLWGRKHSRFGKGWKGGEGTDHPR